MDFQSILITGAGSGLGRALAIACATPGCCLHLCDRNRAGLEETAAYCTREGADVSCQVQDVTDAAAMEDWVKSCGRLDLVISCAGVQFTSLVGEAETADQARATIQVNLMGTLNTVLPSLDVMATQPERGKNNRGQIAVLASLGAFVSVPGASAYCASKAAVDNWAVGRAALARAQGIWITSVCPGYIRTPLTAINGFAMQSLMEPDYAARLILKRLQKRPVRLAFPWQMVAAAKFGGLLPAGFPARMLARNYAHRQRHG